MKMYKILFLGSTMLGTMIIISSYSWLGMWVGLEINLLSIIPLMNNKISFSSESSLKYFITQSLASTIFLYSIIMMMLKLSDYDLLNLNFLFMMNISLFIKMGAAPFHYWFPEIMEGLDWLSSFLILTWQKIGPMMILFNNISSLKLVLLVIIFSMIIGGMMGLNQISVRKILAYSSINHIGWLLMSLVLNFYIWLIYFLVYMMISLILIMMFSKFKIFSLKQFILQLNFNKLEKFSLSLSFMSIGGLPPFLGFFPKWLVINYMLNTSMILMSVFMVLLTLITLFFYIRFILNSLIFYSSQMNLNFKLNFYSFFIFIFNFFNLYGLILFIFIFNFI